MIGCAESPGSFDHSPTVDKSGKVSAKGSVYANSGDYCGPSRSMRLQLLDANGVVLTTLDRTTTGPHAWLGNWSLSGQLPTTLPAGTNYVRVKVKKHTFVWHAGRRGMVVRLCLAGVSPTVAIPAV